MGVDDRPCLVFWVFAAKELHAYRTVGLYAEVSYGPKSEFMLGRKVVELVLQALALDPGDYLIVMGIWQR